MERIVVDQDVRNALVSIDAALVSIDAALDRLDSKIDKTAAEVKSELIKWVVSVGILQMALITGLVLKLAH